jgi:hypothetical protein
MEKKSDVCMDNSLGLENLNDLNPLGPLVPSQRVPIPVHVRVSRDSARVVKCVVK